MKIKTTLILFGIVILLFAFVYAFELRKPKENKSKKIEALMNIPKENISRIEIVYTTPKNITLSFSKANNGQWQNQSQLEPKPSQKDINDAVNNALDRSVFDTVKEPEGLNEYGLAKPRVAITYYFEDGTHRKILLGSEVPIGNYVYVKEDTTADIYMVPTSIVEDFTNLISKN